MDGKARTTLMEACLAQIRQELMRDGATDILAQDAPSWFHTGQLEAWTAEERVVAVIAGTQSGKTTFGPYWLRREIQRRGAGEYGVISPNLTLLYKKAQPEFMRLFSDLGRFLASPVPRFELSTHGLRVLLGRTDEPCVVYFGYAENPDSLESMTLKGVWADECGQRAFKRGSWEALQRRLAVNQARACLTTTPYEWNWLKTQVYDRWVNGDASIRVVNFRSIMNPSFAPEEYHRQKGMMPLWRFEMMYDGRFTKPAGMIYDCFDPALHTCAPFAIPAAWRRFQGTDFGNVNTAGVWLAQDPVSGRLYLYRTYHRGGLSVSEPAREMLRGEPRVPFAVGGTWSEDEWRNQYSSVGLPMVRPPFRDVEKGIECVYSLLRRGLLVIFDDLTKVLEEMQTYSRELNDHGEPLLAISEKASYHRLDALRVICAALSSGMADFDRGVESRWERA